MWSIKINLIQNSNIFCFHKINPSANAGSAALLWPWNSRPVHLTFDNPHAVWHPFHLAKRYAGGPTHILLLHAHGPFSHQISRPFVDLWYTIQCRAVWHSLGLTKRYAGGPAANLLSFDLRRPCSQKLTHVFWSLINYPVPPCGVYLICQKGTP